MASSKVICVGKTILKLSDVIIDVTKIKETVNQEKCMCKKDIILKLVDEIQKLNNCSDIEIINKKTWEFKSCLKFFENENIACIFELKMKQCFCTIYLPEKCTNHYISFDFIRKTVEDSLVITDFVVPDFDFFLHNILKKIELSNERHVLNNTKIDNIEQETFYQNMDNYCSITKDLFSQKMVSEDVKKISFRLFCQIKVMSGRPDVFVFLSNKGVFFLKYNADKQLGFTNLLIELGCVSLKGNLVVKDGNKITIFKQEECHNHKFCIYSRPKLCFEDFLNFLYYSKNQFSKIAKFYCPRISYIHDKKSTFQGEAFCPIEEKGKAVFESKPSVQTFSMMITHQILDANYIDADLIKRDLFFWFNQKELFFFFRKNKLLNSVVKYFQLDILLGEICIKTKEFDVLQRLRLENTCRIKSSSGFTFDEHIIFYYDMSLPENFPITVNFKYSFPFHYTKKTSFQKTLSFNVIQGLKQKITQEHCRNGNFTWVHAGINLPLFLNFLKKRIPLGIFIISRDMVDFLQKILKKTDFSYKKTSFPVPCFKKTYGWTILHYLMIFNLPEHILRLHNIFKLEYEYNFSILELFLILSTQYDTIEFYNAVRPFLEKDIISVCRFLYNSYSRTNYGFTTFINYVQIKHVQIVCLKNMIKLFDGRFPAEIWLYLPILMVYFPNFDGNITFDEPEKCSSYFFDCIKQNICCLDNILNFNKEKNYLKYIAMNSSFDEKMSNLKRLRNSFVFVSLSQYEQIFSILIED